MACSRRRGVSMLLCNRFSGAMPSLVPACSREAAKLNCEREHVVLRESMPPRSPQREFAAHSAFADASKSLKNFRASSCAASCWLS